MADIAPTQNRFSSCFVLYAGEYVYVNNTTVYDNACLRLNAGEVIIIDEPFIVHENAEMMINKAP